MEENKIFLDFNATTPMEKDVVDILFKSAISDWGNPSSKNYYGMRAKLSISLARQQIADMLNGKPEEITFTSGGTEANNMIIFGILKYFEKLSANDGNKPHVITSTVEHDSVLLPLKHLESQQLIEVSYVGASHNGCILVEDLFSKVKNNTCLITVMFANNETGVIMPIKEIGDRLAITNEKRQKDGYIKILFHSDAAQIIGKKRVNVNCLNIDYLTVVGHKFYGPRIGCIWAKQMLFPMLYGGGQERNIRPGTENTPMIVALGKAAEIVNNNVDTYERHFLKLRNFLESELKGEFGENIVINCEGSDRLANTCNVSFIGQQEFTGADLLSKCKIVVASVGAACHSGKQCSNVLLCSGVPESLAKTAVRISLGRDSDSDNLRLCVKDLKEAYILLNTNKK